MTHSQRRARVLLAGRVEIVGTVVGTGIGGVVGLVIGLSSYWPTAPFAVVEGGIFGLVLGTGAACVPALVVLLSALAIRR